MADVTFRIGDGTDSSVYIRVDNTDGSPPQIRWNASTNLWEISNDGSTYSAITTSAGWGADGTWSAPGRLGPLRVWTDTSVSPKVIRYKDGADPENESDGKELLVGTSGATF